MIRHKQIDHKTSVYFYKDGLIKIKNKATNQEVILHYKSIKDILKIIKQNKSQ